MSQYVEYDRLIPELKKMVDAGKVDIKAVHVAAAPALPLPRSRW